MSKRHVLVALTFVMALLFATVAAGASTPGPDVRLTNDFSGGYVSNYTAVTGSPYTDATLAECGKARGRQNEPSVAIDPRNTNVIVGSSNDYCGVYDNTDPPRPVGPIWLGYYRSENGGAGFQSSLVPGYPDDSSPYKSRAMVRTASAGDPVLAWDNHGRLYAGAESSDDPAGSKKGFGDVWVATYENPQGPDGAQQLDGKEFKRSVIVARGSSAPGTGGKFNDKTSIEVDRTGGACDGAVYFAYSRFTGNGGVGIYFSRSINNGQSFTAPKKVSAGIHDVQFPDIAVTGNGHVYVTYRQFEANGHQTDNVIVVKSADCGRSFSAPKVVTPFLRHDAVDVSAPAAAPAAPPDDPQAEESDAPSSLARDCGDFGSACQSGYTFFRHDTGPRSTADQKDRTHEWVYLVYDAGKPTVVNTGTTYGTITPGKASQGGIYFVRYDGASGAKTAPALISDQASGHQIFADIAADAGALHAIWWDSRNDPCYSVTRPIGNCADGTVVPALDVYGATSSNQGTSWSNAALITDARSNGNFEQFADRTVPFGGDYLWVDAVGSSTFGTWTDWRNTVAGGDPREATADDADNADVLQCRAQLADGSFSSDQCPRSGGLDQNIYGDKTP